MNFIVATVLFISIGNEAETYSFMNKIFIDFGVLNLFERKFAKVLYFCKIFHESLEKYDKSLEKHIKTIGLDDSF